VQIHKKKIENRAISYFAVSLTNVISDVVLDQIVLYLSLNAHQKQAQIATEILRCIPVRLCITLFKVSVTQKELIKM
jgi:hypothetical protein